MTSTIALEISLIIPDNEALTALTTLRRLGIHVEKLERAELWRFEVEPAAERALVEAVRATETMYNPNKHRLRVRPNAVPEAGEVWIDEPGSPAAHRAPPYRFAGRDLPGVRGLERFVAWRLAGPEEKPAADAIVQRAVETLLCNPAFQRAIR